MARGFTPPAECPVCGESVPPNARACPGCGADERSGWNEDDTRYDGLDLPDEAFGDGKPPRVRRASPTLWVVVAIVLLVLFAAGVMFR